MTRPDFDQDQAISEGWILYIDTYSASVTALTRSTFRDMAVGNTPEALGKSADAKALAFVEASARQGSAYHIHALAITQLT